MLSFQNAVNIKVSFDGFKLFFPYEIFKILCVFSLLAHLNLDQPRSEWSTAAYGLGRTVQIEGKKSDSLSWPSLWRLGQIWSQIPCLICSPKCFCRIKPSAIDPTPYSLGCLQYFFQAVHLRTGLPVPLQCLPPGFPTQGSTMISNLTPWARFPWPLYAVTSFLPCVNIVFP